MVDVSSRAASLVGVEGDAPPAASTSAEAVATEETDQPSPNTNTEQLTVMPTPALIPRSSRPYRRYEVLHQHVRDQRASRVERLPDPQISSEFLDCTSS